MSNKTTEQLINQYVRKEIRAINAYHVQPAIGMVKLDAMENPFVWEGELQQQWLKKIQLAEINRYPDPAANTLNEKLRSVMGIPEQAGVVLGNGSDELIQIISMVMAGHGRTILAPTPSFVMYDMVCTFTDGEFIGVPLKENDFQLDMPAMLSAIQQHQPAVIFLAYPNNPTGNLFNRDDIEQIIDAAPGLVVIDEAYHVFADSSYMAKVLGYSNVIVMRTLSKLGLAGLRFGFMAGPASLMQELEKVRMPYNINVLTQISAEFALENMSFFHDKAQQIIQQREKMEYQLSELSIVEKVYPSDANMILFKVKGSATEVYEGLKQQQVLIKNMHRDNTPLANHLRVTVGAPEENALFLKALATI